MGPRCLLPLNRQLKLIESMNQRMTLNPGAVSKNSTSAETVLSSVGEFFFDLISGISFDSWYKMYEDIFTIDLAHLDDAQMVQKLLHKLGTSEHEKYVNYILPKNPRDLSFDQTISILKQMFGEQTLLFNVPYQCLKLVKSDDDWVTYDGIVNRECENSKLRQMTDDQFKCLIFICGLQSDQDADIYVS